MSRIGSPLVEVVGKPRINPKTLPLPHPVPEPTKEKEPEKVPVRTEAESLIQRVAVFLGVSDAWVVDKILYIADLLEVALRLGEKRKSMTAKAQRGRSPRTYAAWWESKYGTSIPPPDSIA